MALITIAGSMNAGDTTPITVDRSELDGIPTDVYFQDQSNWARIRIDYKSPAGNQRSETDVTSGSGTFTVSNRARTGDWSVHRIVIFDYDGGSYTVASSDITDVSNYDITIS